MPRRDPRLVSQLLLPAVVAPVSEGLVHCQISTSPMCPVAFFQHLQTMFQAKKVVEAVVKSLPRLGPSLVGAKSATGDPFTNEDGP